MNRSKKIALLTSAVLTVAGIAAPSLSLAATVCVGGTCNVTIAADPTAPNGNFATPGSTATAGYTIQTSDDGTNFHVVLDSKDPTALNFANLYFDTIASTPNTGSNLGFEFGPIAANNDAFDPNTSNKYSLVGTGVTASFTDSVGDILVSILIPNSFFLTNPDNMPFAVTPNGTLVSLHLSQSFGYSVVGGSANFAAPVELGDAIVGSVAPTPEPNSLLLLSTGLLGAGGMVRRRFSKS